jgi:hypothetical protein
MINQNLITLLELLRIESNAILQHKIRLGSENEGGYILIDNIKHITKLYSLYDTFPAVYPFEKHFVDYTKSTAHFYNTKLLTECLFENNDLGKNKAVILKNHGLLTVGKTIDEAAWWFITMERSCQAQLLAEAAGVPSPIKPEYAKIAYSQVGSPEMGWFSFQSLYEMIVRQEPDFLE